MWIVIIIIILIIILLKFIFNKYCTNNIANRIIPYLWVGNRIASLDNEFLKKNNIKLIINCTKTLPFIDNQDITKYRLSVHDNGSQDTKKGMLQYIDNIIELIDIHIKNKEGVLIHCYAGMQRAPTIACCYIIDKLGLDLNKSINYIKKYRKIAFIPKMNYFSVINTFYNKKIENYNH